MAMVFEANVSIEEDRRTENHERQHLRERLLIAEQAGYCAMSVEVLRRCEAIREMLRRGVLLPGRDSDMKGR